MVKQFRTWRPDDDDQDDTDRPEWQPRPVGALVQLPDGRMTRQWLTLGGRPYARLGTLAQGGPYPRLRLDYFRRMTEGRAAWDLIIGGGVSVRSAARTLGLSPTTAWRRAWWWHDAVILPAWNGYSARRTPIPPQRGTRACPNGRPYLPYDAADIVRDLVLDQDIDPAVIAASPAMPAYVRRVARRVEAAMMRDLLDLVAEQDGTSGGTQEGGTPAARGERRRARASGRTAKPRAGRRRA